MLGIGIGSTARTALCGLLVLLVAASCRDYRGITISPDRVTLAVGETKRLSVTVHAPGVVDGTVTWRSDDTAIARVDTTGLVTAVGPGTATVTAISNHDTSLQAAATVTVVAGARRPLWTRTYDTGGYGAGMGVVTDSNDSVVVTGYVDYHPDPRSGPEPFSAFVRKYSSDGATEWHREFEHAMSSGVAIDAADNIVISGRGSAVDFDAFVRKYSADGGLEWTRQFEVGNTESLPRVAVDDLGNSIVAGSVNLAAGGDWPGGVGGVTPFLRKYSPSGILLWAKRFADAEVHTFEAAAVDVDGSIVVTGVVFLDAASFPDSSDMHVTKYSPDGDLLWTDRFGSNQADWARTVSIDSDGSVLVAGSATGTIGDATSGDDGRLFVRKYLRDGTRIWTRQFGSADSVTSIYGVTADAGNDILVAGFATGTFAFPRVGNDDVFVGKLTQDGDVVWTDQFGTTDSDGAEGVTTDSMGNVVITGRLGAVDPGTGVQSEVFVRKYGP